MYRAPSPVYDVPDIPILRRVKPLPKRRRTSDHTTHDHLDPGPGGGGGGSSGLPGATIPSAQQQQQQPQQQDGDSRTEHADEAGVPAPPDAFSAQAALQAYYMPVLGGVRELYKGPPPADGDPAAPPPLDLSSALAGLGSALGYGYTVGRGPQHDTGFGGGGGGGGGGAYADGRDVPEDDESGEGDYVDHLQQPGNTKKRKVPANMSGSAHGHDSASAGSGAEDEPAERGVPTARERDGPDGAAVGDGGGGGGGGGTGTGTGTGGGLGGAAQGLAAQGRGGGGGGGGTRLGRLTRATVAGLQHKEMLRSRKRQLATVLGALAHGDTLALDQALSASYPFVQTGVDYRTGAPVRVRLSRRREARLARAFKALSDPAGTTTITTTTTTTEDTPDRDEEPTQAPAQVQARTQASTKEKASKPPPPAKASQKPLAPKAPSTAFTFVCHSATSDRLVATKEEVAVLHSRFEEELARQAAKAAEAAKQAAAALNGPVAKRTDRSKPGARGSAAGKGADAAGGATGADGGAAGGGKGKGGKKKKRSALANASNPHHLRNYVPSRLPHSGPPSAAQAAANAQNLLSPLPKRFLEAQIPPRRPKRAEGAATAPAPASAPAPATPALTALTSAEEEWICPFCEYQLFYGDEQAYHRAVRNRKKILRRRRRARERAAAAASGVAPATGAPAPAAADKGEPEDAYDAPAPGSSPSKAAKWKEGDRGGRGMAAAHA